MMCYLLVDLDGTLKSDWNYGMDCHDDYLFTFKTREEYKIRPFALEFLNELKRYGKVCIFSGSSQKFVEKIINEIGSDVECFGWDNLHNVPAEYLQNYIVLDNDPNMAISKIKEMENGKNLKDNKRWMIKVDTYMGNDDDRVLMDILNNLGIGRA